MLHRLYTVGGSMYPSQTREGTRYNTDPDCPCCQSSHRMQVFLSDTTLLHSFNGPVSRTAWISQHQKGETSLDLNEARDDGVAGRQCISWTICKQSAPRSKQITTPAPHRSIFTGRMLFLTPNQQCQSTEGTVIPR